MPVCEDLGLHFECEELLVACQLLLTDELSLNDHQLTLLVQNLHQLIDVDLLPSMSVASFNRLAKYIYVYETVDK